MSSQQIPLSAPSKTERVNVYIDGFNLYFGLKAAKLRRFYWLDVQALAVNLLQPHQTLGRVKYFTARVSPSKWDPSQHLRQKTYLEALETLPLVGKPILGHYLSKNKTCKKCNASWQVQEEKMTDVNIAVEMLADATTDQCDTLMVISGDSDLTGPIVKIKELTPKKRIIVAFPPERHSTRLQQEAHGSFRIGDAKIRQSQLPDPVVKPDGYALKKPTQWK